MNKYKINCKCECHLPGQANFDVDFHCGKCEFYNEHRPQWKCDLALLLGKIIGNRNTEDYDIPLENFIESLFATKPESDKCTCSGGSGQENPAGCAININNAYCRIHNPKHLIDDWGREIKGSAGGTDPIPFPKNYTNGHTKPESDKEKHQHQWTMVSTIREPQNMTTGTSSFYVEYAYLLCQCGRVKKTKITQ